MNRRAGWEILLGELFQARRNVPFSWGSNDCVLFAADAIVALTNTDPVEPHRGTYNTEAQARAKLRRYGPQFLYQMRNLFGAFPRVPVRQLQRGDIALARFNRQLVMSVYYQSELYAPGDDGLASLPLSAGLEGWAVGHG